MANSPLPPVLDDFSGLFSLKYDMMLGKLEKNYIPTINRTVMLVNVIDKEQIEEITTKPSTTNTAMTTKEPKCILKNHPVLYNGYGCYCGIGNSGEPHDAVDKCCLEHDNCKEHSKNKCPSSTTSFDIFSVSIYASNYNWKCEGSGSTIKCPDSTNNECQQFLCNCDKALIDCLSSNPKPKQVQPCWSNINETIEEATKEPIKAVENVKIDIINAKEKISSILEVAKKGSFNKQEAADAINAAVKASRDFRDVTDKIFEKNREKRQKAKAKLDAAVEKAEKTNSFDDWKAADKALDDLGIVIIEIETIGRKMDEGLKVQLEMALATHNLVIQMGDYIY